MPDLAARSPHPGTTKKVTGLVTSPNRPECLECGRGTRVGRSLLCEDCRAARRRARKTETQRARRAAAKRDPEIEALTADLQATASRLGEHLRRQEQKQELNSVQRDALHLAEQATALAMVVAQRGLRPAQAVSNSTP